MITGTQVATAGRALAGIRWQHQGRSVHGLDCLGFELLASRNAGIDLTARGFRDRRDYGLKAMPDLLDGHQQWCRPTTERHAGAAALFQFDRDPYPRHVAILTDNGGMIHANAAQGCVVEHGLRAQWARWLHSVWLLPGVQYP